MGCLKRLPVAIAALTLIVPVVSATADPNYFASLGAFADDGNSSNFSIVSEELKMETEGSGSADGEHVMSFGCENYDLEQEPGKSLEVESEGEFETDLLFFNGSAYEVCRTAIGEKMKLDVDDQGVEVEVELDGLTLADGLYDTVLSCTEPKVNMTFPDSFEVEDGEGEFEADIALTNGTYDNCALEVEGMIIAMFG